MKPEFFYGMKFLLISILLVSETGAHVLRAQDVMISAPQKITPGISKVEVLGRSSEGILVRHVMKEEDHIIAFYDNMQQRWRKAIPHREKNAVTQEVIAYEDSLLFFYYFTQKGITLLQGYKTTLKMESPSKSIFCDTLARNQMNPVPLPDFITTPDKQLILCYYVDPNFRNTHIVHLLCFNKNIRKLWEVNLKVEDFQDPEVISAVMDSAGNVTVVTGNRIERSFSNDFPFTALGIYTVRDRGLQIRKNMIKEPNTFFSACEARPDLQNGNIIMAGMYASETGSKSSGIYFMSFNPVADSLYVKSYCAHTNEFLTQLSGNNPPKKNDGFWDFKPTELIVRRDGGAIFVAESQSVNSESYSNPSVGGFGISSGFSINYFHYNDLVVVSFREDGFAEWKQVLHKKQVTESDGGFFSSIATVIAPAQIHFVYNDVINGQSVVANYSIDATGNQSRNEMFGADRKGVMPVPKSSKQISANELLMPSFRKNYLQFIKITF